MKLLTISVANKSLFSKSSNFKAVLENEVGALYCLTFTNERQQRWRDGK